jgi:hypothetical protein
MGAVVIDLKDFGVRTPEQVVRVFFGLYDGVSVRRRLWEVFRLYAVNDEKGISALDRDEAEVALLFDHLIDLVGAIEVLRAVRGVERCVLCGRADDVVGD